jgi:hypothetical protein
MEFKLEQPQPKPQQQQTQDGPSQQQQQQTASSSGAQADNSFTAAARFAGPRQGCVFTTGGCDSTG